MIQIKEVKKYIIEYKCDCGAVGECMFKPPEHDVLMVTDIQCPMCGDIENVRILKQSDNEQALENIEDVDLYWPIIIENKIKGDE